MQSDNLYARLELLDPEQLTGERSVTSGASTTGQASRWQRWGQTLLNFFAGSLEPRITTRQDRQGAVYYEVYDPIDRRRYTFVSERDVRVWLEERYYQ